MTSVFLDLIYQKIALKLITLFIRHFLLLIYHSKELEDFDYNRTFGRRSHMVLRKNLL